MGARRVLVIDDDDSIREVAQVTLEVVARWTVLTASGGAEGLSIAGEEQPDAILMDVMMPGMDGPATLERLRADPRTAQIPVIFMTASVHRAEREHLDSLAPAGVLAKPFDPMRLGTEIADLLGWQA